MPLTGTPNKNPQLTQLLTAFNQLGTAFSKAAEITRQAQEEKKKELQKQYDSEAIAAFARVREHLINIPQNKREQRGAFLAGELLKAHPNASSDLIFKLYSNITQKPFTTDKERVRREAQKSFAVSRAKTLGQGQAKNELSINAPIPEDRLVRVGDFLGAATSKEEAAKIRKSLNSANILQLFADKVKKMTVDLQSPISVSANRDKFIAELTAMQNQFIAFHKRGLIPESRISDADVKLVIDALGVDLAGNSITQTAANIIDSATSGTKFARMRVGIEKLVETAAELKAANLGKLQFKSDSVKNLRTLFDGIAGLEQISKSSTTLSYLTSGHLSINSLKSGKNLISWELPVRSIGRGGKVMRTFIPLTEKLARFLHMSGINIPGISFDKDGIGMMVNFREMKNSVLFQQNWYDKTRVVIAPLSFATNLDERPEGINFIAGKSFYKLFGNKLLNFKGTSIDNLKNRYYTPRRKR